MDDQGKNSALLSSFCSPAAEPGEESRSPWLHFGCLLMRTVMPALLCATPKIPQAIENHVKKVTISSWIREYCWQEDLTASCGSLIQRVQDLYHHAFVDSLPGKTFLKLLVAWRDNVEKQDTVWAGRRWLLGNARPGCLSWGIQFTSWSRSFCPYLLTRQ